MRADRADSPGQLVLQARRRHGISQRELAARIGSTQAAISRIERGVVSPTFDTLSWLMMAMGEGVGLEARPFGHDLSLLAQTLRRTPQQRLASVESAAELFREARRSRAGSRPVADG